jgi:hypothetical protein
MVIPTLKWGKIKMTGYEAAAAKIRELPEPLIQEVSDFIDFLQIKSDSTRWQLWILFNEALEIAESDFADYLPNLEDYENRLAREEIKW